MAGTSAALHFRSSPRGMLGCISAVLALRIDFDTTCRTMRYVRRVNPEHAVKHVHLHVREITIIVWRALYRHIVCLLVLRRSTPVASLPHTVTRTFSESLHTVLCKQVTS